MKRLLWVGKSRMAGRGLFPARPINAGSRIIRYTGESIDTAESAKRLAEGNVYIFELDERWDIDGKALSHTARFINQAWDPHCRVEQTTRSLWIVALRDIREGEERSYNAGYGPESPQYPCTCGAKNACGFMLSPLYQEVVWPRGNRCSEAASNSLQRRMVPAVLTIGERLIAWGEATKVWA